MADRCSINPADYRALGSPGAEGLGNVFQCKREFESDFCGAWNPAVARALNPALRDSRTWLEGAKGRTPLG